MKEKEKKLFNYSEENIKESEYSSGDKQSPMASGGKTETDFTTEQIKKESGQPGGEENAAGEDSVEKNNRSGKVGSTPVSDETLDKGERG